MYYCRTKFLKIEIHFYSSFVFDITIDVFKYLSQFNGIIKETNDLK